MPIYQKVLWTIGLLALAALCLGGFLITTGALPQIIIDNALGSLYLSPMIRSAAALIFALLFILSIYLPYATWVEGQGAVVSLKNPLGEVEISQKAISDFIQRVGGEVEEVQDLHARVKSTEEGLDVFVTLAVQSQGEIPRLINELQTIIKNYLNKTVGIENIGEVKVRVAKIL